jgi:hypothetical protein
LLIDLNLTGDDKEENMPKQNDRKAEQIFNKLSNYGYSKKVAEIIWLWYNPSEKIEPVSNFKPIVKEKTNGQYPSDKVFLC